MDREELTALRDAIDMVLALPDAVRAEMARWLAPEASRPTGRGNGASEAQTPGNGLDPHPQANSLPREVRNSVTPPAPYVGKSKRGRPKASAKIAERKLLEAMQDNPGLTVIALANAAGSSRSGTGERLRVLAARGAVEKDAKGRWRLVGEKPREDGARPIEASP